MNVPVLVSALALAGTLSACLTSWPGAPYFDVVDEVPTKVARELDASHRGARRVTPVYRRHVEGRWGRYRIVSQCFLLEDPRSTVRRVEIDESGSVRVHPATRTEALPEELRQIFFAREHAVARGGVVSGPVWYFDDQRGGERVYEFEFTVDGQRGLGRIGESGRHMSAEPILPDRDHP